MHWCGNSSGKFCGVEILVDLLAYIMVESDFNTLLTMIIVTSSPW